MKDGETSKREGKRTGDIEEQEGVENGTGTWKGRKMFNSEEKRADMGKRRVMKK